MSVLTAIAPKTAEPSSPPRKDKDPYFSNAKLALIVLVVCGHAWEPFLGNDTARVGYFFVYELHMPAFILISGFLSRHFTARPDQLRRMVTGVVLPYLLFSVAYGLMRWWTEGAFEWNLLYPWGLMWFLPALFVWRLTSPIWRVVRWPVAVSFAIAFAASMTELSNVLDLSRMLLYLPFFVVGACLRREHFTWLRERLWTRWTGLALSLGVLGGLAVFSGPLKLEWIYYSKGGDQLDVPLQWVLPIRVAMYAAAFILVGTFLAWVPDRELRLTALGERTIYAYLLHQFFVMAAAGGLDLYRFDVVHTPVGAAGVTVLAALLAVALMTVPVRRVFRWAIEPGLPWMFTATARRSPRELRV